MIKSPIKTYQFIILSNLDTKIDRYPVAANFQLTGEKECRPAKSATGSEL